MSTVGWKSIEMQVAIPRTQDAGKLQDQMSKQNQEFQESLAQMQTKQEEKKRNRVNAFDQVNHLNIKKDPESRKQSSQEKESHQQKDSGSGRDNQANHPYLGNTIDFSG